MEFRASQMKKEKEKERRRGGGGENPQLKFPNGAERNVPHKYYDFFIADLFSVHEHHALGIVLQYWIYLKHEIRYCRLGKIRLKIARIENTGTWRDKNIHMKLEYIHFASFLE